MTQPSWEELHLQFIQYRAGDSQVVRKLFESLSRLLIRFCEYKGSRIEAEDLVQQILLKIHINREEFDEKRNFKSWVFSIAQNHLIDAWRTNKEKSYSFEDEAAVDDILSMEIGSLRIENSNEIEVLLQSVSPSDQNILKLYFYEEFSSQEIATMLKISESSVKVKIHRLLKRMRLEK